MVNPDRKPVEVFFSYSHKDERLRDKLAAHLKILERQGLIQSWHDRRILAGSEWAEAIDQHMNSAQVILLLVSADFLASDYCYSIELERAMERHEAGEAQVIPIILRDVDWSGAPFGKLQALPKNAKPVTAWKPQDEAFTDIAKGIRHAIATLPPPPSRPSSSPPPPPSSPHSLETPEGQVPLTSPFYLDRPPIEADCYEEIIKPGALIRVKAPRQMGKSSLMARILDHAEQHGCRKVSLNFQESEMENFASLDGFLQWFCANVADELERPDRLADLWQGAVGTSRKCSNYFQRYLLAELDTPLALGLDEVDQVFEHLPIAKDFFGLLRAWHEKGKNNSVWQKLRLVLVHSQEVYIPLHINQSPFNVGLAREPGEFSRAQVQELVQRHGLQLAAGDVEQLMAVVGGHPYLVRVALDELARRRSNLPDLLQAAPREGGLYGDHLRRHWLNLEANADLLAAMGQVLSSQQPVRVGSSEAFKLRSMGLVKFQEGGVVPLCGLYRTYFRDRLPK